MENKTDRTGEEITIEGELLLPIESILSAGIHIGTRVKTKDMRPFIYKVRHDGLSVLDIKKTDERVRVAAKFLSRFDPLRVAVVSSRIYGRTPVQKFCEYTHMIPIVGRFPPGIFSNQYHSKHREIDVLVATDPKADKQAVNEASLVGIPVIALCDTDNSFKDVDLVIPTNNKGRRALATIYWLLARQVLSERGDLTPGADLPIDIDAFETKLAEVSTTD